MVLRLNPAKRDKKTGKIDKTGPRLTVGNVSRGSAGGYTTGIIDGLSSNGRTDPRGKPIYGAPDTAPFSQNFTPIVPNSIPSPVLQNTPDRGAGEIPNSQFVNGYNPALPAASTAPSIPPVAPAVSPSSSISPAGAQEAQIPTGASFIEQPTLPPGFQSGAVSEVTPGDVMILQGIAGLAKSVTTTLAGFARDAAIAATVGGSTTLAVQAAPTAASGVLKAGASAAGKAAPNTATARGLVDLATETASGKLISLGLLLSTIKSSLSTSAKYKQESTAKIIEVTDLMNKLQRSGDPVLMDQAQQLRDQLGEAVNDVNRFRSYAPFGVLSGEVDKDFDELEILLKEKTIEYDNNVQDDAAESIIQQLGENPTQEDVSAAKVFLSTLPNGQQKTALQQAINDAQSIADTNEQEFQRQQQESQQAFQTAEREARQAFEQQTRDAALAQRQFDEDTATTTSDGSTLSFGLLGTSGATEFVDRDTASKAYFDGKVYEELTPAQQRLLNLLKGKGGN